MGGLMATVVLWVYFDLLQGRGTIELLSHSRMGLRVYFIYYNRVSRVIRFSGNFVLTNLFAPAF